MQTNAAGGTDSTTVKGDNENVRIFRPRSSSAGNLSKKWATDKVIHHGIICNGWRLETISIREYRHYEMEIMERYGSGQNIDKVFVMKQH